MLERIWEDATSFAFPEERFDRVYEEVERALYEGVLQSAIAAPLPGLVMERDRVEIGDGLALVRGDLSGAPPEAIWPAGAPELDRGGRVRPRVVAVLDAELPADAQLPVPEARWRLRRLVTALRLWRAGSVALPATGWARADDGPWRQVALQPAPPARGGAWALGADEEEGFKQFANLVADWEPTGPMAWALARFDMGCERGADAEALSDYLLALRGLLDAVDEAGQPTLGRRLAALCAEEVNRSLLMSRVDAALNLELALIAGVPIDAWTPPAGVRSGRELIAEIEEHLRALLRDVVCGYLKPELASMADEILLGSHSKQRDGNEMRESVGVPISIHPEPAMHPLDPPTIHRAPAMMPPEAEPRVTRLVDLINEPDQPQPNLLPEHRSAPVAEPPPVPHRERHRASVHELRPSPAHEQPALVMDDFAWDLDEPEDYSAPV
jgi:hypothetical protein